MTCPHCGAYSPKNTSVCNRCGRRLPMEQAQEHTTAEYRMPEHTGYGYGYRQPQQTKFRIFLERVWELMDVVAETPALRRTFFAAVGVVILLIVLRCCGVCTGCSGCGGDAVSFSDAVSVGDVSQSDVSASDVSFTDAE